MMFRDSDGANDRAEVLAEFVEKPLLVGENWIINSEINDELQPALGGELVGG